MRHIFDAAAASITNGPASRPSSFQMSRRCGSACFRVSHSCVNRPAP